MSRLSPGVVIGGASPDHARHDSDFYATPPAATRALLSAWRPPLGLGWEPACGDGALSKVLYEAGLAHLASDLRHAGYSPGGVDFLTAPLPDGIRWIITNPPFSLAEAFIERCLSWSVPFALLLKPTYWHAATRTPLFYRHRPEMVLPLTFRCNFAPERGKSPTMDVCWVVWGAEPAEDCVYRPVGRP